MREEGCHYLEAVSLWELYKNGGEKKRSWSYRLKKIEGLSPTQHFKEEYYRPSLSTDPIFKRLCPNLIFNSHS